MNMDLDLKKIRPKLKKASKIIASRATFIAVLGVLIIYLVLVFKISNLSTAEPSPEAESLAITASTNIPKINKAAVDQIEELEASSSEIQSLFNKARTNPFSE